MTLSLPTMRGKSLTMIGAISEKRGMIHYELFAGSNTAESFSNFLTKLKLKCRYPAVVVQDNLSVHKARVTLTYLLFCLPGLHCGLLLFLCLLCFLCL